MRKQLDPKVAERLKQVAKTLPDTATIFAEFPSVSDKALVRSVMKLCKEEVDAGTPIERSLVHRELSLSSEARHLYATRTVMNFRALLGSFTMSFRSDLLDDEIIAQLSRAASLEAPEPGSPEAIGNAEYAALCRYYWTCAIRGISHNIGSGCLATGLHRRSAEAILKAPIEAFTKFMTWTPQRFACCYSDFVLKMAEEVPDFEHNLSCVILKNLSAIQAPYRAEFSDAYFERARTLLSKCEDYDNDEDVFRLNGGINDAIDPINAEVIRRSRINHDCLRVAEARVIGKRVSEANVMRVERRLLMGFATSQVYCVSNVNLASIHKRATELGGYGLNVTDDRKSQLHNDTDYTAEDLPNNWQWLIFRHLFLALYLTLAGEKALRGTDIDAVYMAHQLLMSRLTPCPVGRHSEAFRVSDAFDLAQQLAQSLVYVDYCPVCGTVAFNARRPGSFKHTDHDCACPACYFMSIDPTLGSVHKYFAKIESAEMLKDTMCDALSDERERIRDERRRKREAEESAETEE